jgi:hypothetical protein
MPNMMPAIDDPLSPRAELAAHHETHAFPRVV